VTVSTLFLPLTLNTTAYHVQVNLSDLKIVLLAQITHQLLAEGILEFDDLATVLADEVMVFFCVP